MSTRMTGFAAMTLTLVGAYFAIAAWILHGGATSRAEDALVTGLAVLAGGFGIAAFLTTLLYLTLRNEAEAARGTREWESKSGAGDSVSASSRLLAPDPLVRRRLVTKRRF